MSVTFVSSHLIMHALHVWKYVAAFWVFGKFHVFWGVESIKPFGRSRGYNVHTSSYPFFAVFWDDRALLGD